eukprot:3814799-Rhodomonas_salina.2
MKRLGTEVDEFQRHGVLSAAAAGAGGGGHEGEHAVVVVGELSERQVEGCAGVEGPPAAQGRVAQARWLVAGPGRLEPASAHDRLPPVRRVALGRHAGPSLHTQHTTRHTRLVAVVDPDPVVAWLHVQRLERQRDPRPRVLPRRVLDRPGAVPAIPVVQAPGSVVDDTAFVAQPLVGRSDHNLALAGAELGVFFTHLVGSEVHLEALATPRRV